MSNSIVNGIVNVYKEPGFTSFDVVAKLRGVFHQKKIGHTGTLDPEAVGVLPVCLGNATRVCELLTDHEKTYEALMVVGFSTDTGDTSGVIRDNVICSFTEDIVERFKAAAESFVGDYDQIPPMYSAKKINGKKLYEYARKGQVVDRKPCRVHISELQVLQVSKGLTEEIKRDFFLIGQEEKSVAWSMEQLEDLLWARIRVTCSKGTYIRTLCEDIGNKLNTYACMAGLIRTKVGGFEIERACTLEEISQKVESDIPMSEFVHSVDSVFEKYLPAYIGTEEANKALMNGNLLKVKDLNFNNSELELTEGQSFRIYDLSGDFKAIYSVCTQDKEYLRATKMFL